MSTLRFDSPSPALPSSASASASRDGREILSVVVPARNEGPGLPRLVDEIVGTLRPLRRGPAGPGVPRLRGFEILVVDDGSTDATAAILADLAATIAELRPLILARNVGQSAATAAGFHAARGDWVATLDADLQNDPADLAALWEALPGHDAVLGWRARRADTWSRRAISRAANAVRNAILGQSIRDTGCSMRIFRREDALRMPAFQGVHRFYGPLLIREGCRVLQVPVNHRARAHGRSHYNFRNRSLRVVVDLLGVAWLMRRPLRYEVAERPRRIDRAGAFAEAESMSKGA